MRLLNATSRPLLKLRQNFHDIPKRTSIELSYEDAARFLICNVVRTFRSASLAGLKACVKYQDSSYDPGWAK